MNTGIDSLRCPLVLAGIVVGLLFATGGSAEEEAPRAAALALASADFDSDGTPDLALSRDDGTIEIRLGNPRSIYPFLPGSTSEPFLAVSATVAVDGPVDYLAAGDFDADGYADLVAATTSGKRLILLAGDGTGRFARPETIALPGRLTAMAAGEVNRRDGLLDLAVATTGKGQSTLLVYQSPRGALRDDPEIVNVGEPVSALAIGRLDDDAQPDVALAAGNGIQLLHGRDRKLDYDAKRRPPVKAATLSVLLVGPTVRDLAVAPSVDASRESLYALTRTGELLAIETRREKSGAEDGTDTPDLTRRLAQAEAGARILATSRHRNAENDLILSTGSKTLAVSTRKAGDVVELPGPGAPIAVLPMRLDADALDDLVMIERSSDAPQVAMTLGGSTFVVSTTADGGIGSLRDAIIDSNTLAGVDMIVFDIPGPGPHTIQPLSVLPAITESATVDATTQPGYAGTPLVELDGQLAGLLGSGLRVSAGATTIRGLAINRFPTGVTIAGDASIVEACHVGTDPAGTTALGNSNDGVWITGPRDVVIGGTSPAAANLISGNVAVGVTLTTGDNRVIGNKIGTNLAGDAALANSSGIRITGDFNTIGGTASGAGNLVSGNTAAEIEIGGAEDALIQGNLIGTNAAGSASLLTPFGITAFGAVRTLVGGTTSSARNLISGNSGGPGTAYGVKVVDTSGAGMDNRIQGNRIGTNATGTASIPNGFGVWVVGTADDLIGGSLLSGGGNLISGNTTGISITDGVRTAVQGNLVGLDNNGTAAVPNTFRGIHVGGNSVDVLIGGSTFEAANLVSGNGLGVHVQQSGGTPDGTRILGNVIGIDVTGAAPLPNTDGGIRVDAAEATTIGGVGDERNVVSASPFGITILGSPTVGTRVLGNYIGTDTSGTVGIGNSNGILLFGAAGHTIGEPGKGNVIADSLSRGIFIDAGSSDNVIDSNFIGLDGIGTIPLPNNNGVRIDGPSNTVLRNVISTNTETGVELAGQGSVGNVVTGNSIGVTVMDPPVGNGVGVNVVLGGDNTISSNRIANSVFEGVRIESGTGNRISLNEIDNNGSRGIDLFPLGVEINDPLDADDGANRLQNYPELTTATYCNVNLNVEGTLHSFPLLNYDVELFLSDACDASGYGEGETPLGTVVVGTDNLGDAAFAFLGSTLFPAGSTPVVTATATDDAGNTSEFSACLSVADGRPGAVIGLGWPNKTELFWSATAGATGYRAYVGTPSQLPDLLNGNIDSLLAWTGVATTTGPFFVSTPASRVFDWAIVRATGPCGEGSPGLASAGLRIHDSGGTASSCAHDKCDPGPADLPLVATCDPCVNEVCAVDASCCATDWGPDCIKQVRTVCNSLTCDESAGACAHPVCSLGGPLVAGCDTPPLGVSCVDAVCALDDFCCAVDWDDLCVDEVLLFCDANCD